MYYWHVTLFVIALALGAWCWSRYRQTDRTEMWLGWLALSAGGAKIWLATGQPQFAVPVALHDDRIFLRLATYLLSGNWLGPYDQLTLVKGPFYPLFMAGVSKLRLPLTLAHNLVYIAAGWLFVRALRPLQLPGWIRASLLLGILLCPVLAGTNPFVRAWRQPLWPGLVLLAVAGAIGLALRDGVRACWKAAWVLLAGSAMAAMWMTREEAIWTVPMLLLPLLYAGWRSVSSRSAPGHTPWLVAPVVLASLAVGVVSWKNYSTYGFWGIVELREDSFIAAYSALSRVEPHDLDRRITVTRAARELIYEVSPAFASLRQEMEEGVGAKFMKITQDRTDIHGVEEREIAGGLMLFALRDAVGLSGQARSADSARAFYRRLADEVNSACADGRLPRCLSPRHTLWPPWYSNYLPKIVWAGLSGANLIMSYRLDPNPVPSIGSAEDLQWVERVTHDRVSPADPEKAMALRSVWRVTVLRVSILAYRYGMSVFFPVASAVWLLLVARALYRWELGPLILISTALVLGIAANLAVVAIIDATSFSAVKSGSGYLGPSIPLAVCFVGLVFAELVTIVKDRTASRS